MTFKYQRFKPLFIYYGAIPKCKRITNLRTIGFTAGLNSEADREIANWPVVLSL
jgi:hypothetical protein